MTWSVRIAVAVAVLLGATVALAVPFALDGDAVLAVDRSAAVRIRDLGGSVFDRAMAVVTQLGSRGFVVPVTVIGALAVRGRSARLATVLLVALPVVLAVDLGAKEIVGRARPPGATAAGHSYPSGHVLSAVIFWGLLPSWIGAMGGPRTHRRTAGIAAALVVLAVGVSRVSLGVHWPSDIVGGALLGSALLLTAYAAVAGPPTEARPPDPPVR